MAINRQLAEGVEIRCDRIRRPEQCDFGLRRGPYAAIYRSQQFHLVVLASPLLAAQIWRTVLRQKLGSTLHSERQHLPDPWCGRGRESGRSWDPDPRLGRKRVRIGNVCAPSIARPQGYDPRGRNLSHGNATSFALTVGNRGNPGIVLRLQGCCLSGKVVPQCLEG